MTATPANDPSLFMSMTPRHAQARQLAAAGIKVFPCEVGGKRPATEHGFKDASADLAKIDAWWGASDYNIGLCPEDVGWAVVDIDPGGESGWIEALTKSGGYTATCEVATPRGGRHIYFKGSLPSTAGKLAPHVDTRGVGGYVLVPPSVVNGQPYRALNDHDPTALPAWIGTLLAAKVSRVEGEDAESDTDVAISRAQSYLRRLVEQGDIAVEGQGGDNRTFRLFAQLKSIGVSQEKALELVAVSGGWNDQCVPPWLPDDLASKAEHGYRYAQNPLGSDTDTRPAVEVFGQTEVFRELVAASEPAKEQDNAPAKEHGTPAVTSWPQPTQYSEVLSRVVPAVKELIPGFLEKGVPTFLSAPGGSHKSRLLQQWGLCLDAGARIWDRSVERAKFVCLSYEDDGDEIARRSQAITRRFNLPIDSTAELWDLAGRDLPIAAVKESGEVALTAFGQHMRDHLRSIEGHKFVGIDSCYNALRFEGKAKINEGSVMAAIGLLQLLCIECNCTMLVLWHPSQAGQERGDASGWSVAWHNAPRARLSLTAVKDTDDAFELKVEKRNHGPKGKALTLYFSSGVLVPRTEIDDATITSRLLDACVQAATDAAAVNTPIQKQRRCDKVWLDKIAAAVGYVPTERVIKEELARAVAQGRLIYRPNKNGHSGAAGYYPAPDSAAGPFVERIRVLANWYARWGVDQISVSQLHRAAVLLVDPGSTTLNHIEGQRLTDDQRAGLADFARQFAQAVDADAFGEAGIRPNKRQAHPEYGLRPVLLAAIDDGRREGGQHA